VSEQTKTTVSLRQEIIAAARADPNTTTQTHQETLRLLLNSDTSPCLYAHEVAALLAAIKALDRSAETHG
jgi:hypothetical protein